MNFLKQLWGKIIAPHKSLTDMEQQRQVALLSSIIATLFLFALVVYPTDILFSDYGFRLGEFILWGFMMGMLWWALMMSHHGKIKRAALVFVTMLSLAIFGLIALSTEAGVTTLTNYFLLPLLVSSLFLSQSITYILLFSIFAGLTVFGVLHPDVSVYEFPLFFLVISTMLINSFIYHIRGVEEARQEALKASEERYRTLFETISDGIIIHKDGEIIDVNHSFEQMYRVRRADIIGTSVLEFISPEDRNRPSEQPPTDDKSVYQVISKTTKGELIPVEIISSKYPYKAEALRVVTVRDLRERIDLEEKRRSLDLKQERLKILRKFIGDASHDLRTPITVIQSSLYLLQRATTEERRQQHLANLTSQVDHMTQIVNNLLTMSKFEAADYHTFGLYNLNTLIKQSLREYGSMAHSKRITMTFDEDSALPDVIMDADDIKIVIDQLIANALRYTIKDGVARLRTLTTNTYVVFEIEDTGIGIAPQNREQIFETFYRVDQARNTDTGGMGLGLSISKRIVDAHKGEIEVESEPGKGSLFRVKLPIQSTLTPNQIED